MQKEAIVWRRFSDFVQLHDRLLESRSRIFHSSETGEIDKKTRRRSVRASAETHVAKLSRKVDQTPIASHIYGIKSVFDAARFTAVARMARTGSSRCAASSTMMSSPAGYQHQEQQQQQQHHHHQETLQPSTPSMQFAPDSHMMASSPIGGVNPASPGGAANGGSAIFTQQNVSASSMMTSPSATSPATPNRSSVGKFFRELRQSMATSSAVAAVGGAFGIEVSSR